MSFVDVQHDLTAYEIQLILLLEAKGYNIAVFSVPLPLWYIILMLHCTGCCNVLFLLSL